VRDQLPLDYHYPSQIKRALQKAHDELLRRDFLSGVNYEGKTEVVYKVSREFARRQKARELSGDPKEIFAIERLIRERIDGDAARELVVTHGPDTCLFYADAVNRQKGVLSRAGWIISAIKGGWAVRDAAQATLQDSLPEVPVEGAEEDVSPRSEQDANPSPPSTPRPDPAAAEVWKKVLQDAEADIDASSLHVWFDEITPVGLRDDVLTISVPNSFAKQYIETRFGDLIRQGLREHQGEGARLEVEVLEVRAR
jgi:hypothetical protein